MGGSDQDCRWAQLELKSTSRTLICTCLCITCLCIVLQSYLTNTAASAHAHKNVIMCLINLRKAGGTAEIIVTTV